MRTNSRPQAYGLCIALDTGLGLERFALPQRAENQRWRYDAGASRTAFPRGPWERVNTGAAGFRLVGNA